MFTICTDQFSFPKNGRESLKLVSKIGLNKWNINFPLEHSDQKIKIIIIIMKTGLLFQMFRCSSRKVCFGTNNFYSCFIYIGHRNFRNLLANVIKPTICRSCCRRCRGWLRSLFSEQTVNIHKIYLLWRVGFRHQRRDYQQLIVESSAK